MKYAKEAKAIWKAHVPKSGQSDTIEGELIRAVEKLRHEAQYNGNGNWDAGFRQFCNYLRQYLHNSKVFDKIALTEISADIKRLRTSYNPYLEDDLYDRLTDRIVKWSRTHDEPIKREHDPEQYR